MCFDPVSLGLMAVGTGLGVAGKVAANKQQTGAQAAEMSARNAVLAQHLDAQKRYGDEAHGITDSLVSRFGAEPAAAQDQAAADKRVGAVTGNLVAPKDTSGPGADLSGKIMARRVLEAFNRATGDAARRAKVSSYGDAWGGREGDILNSSRYVGTINQLARDKAQNLGAQQDLAAYSVYKPPSAIPGLMQDVGGLLGGLAGSGYLGRK